MSATYANQSALERRRAEQAKRTAARLEDLEFMRSTGEHPLRAIERVGWSFKTAETMLHRSGRRDLAAWLRSAL